MPACQSFSEGRFHDDPERMSIDDRLEELAALPFDPLRPALAAGFLRLKRRTDWKVPPTTAGRTLGRGRFKAREAAELSLATRRRLWAIISMAGMPPRRQDGGTQGHGRSRRHSGGNPGRPGAHAAAGDARRVSARRRPSVRASHGRLLVLLAPRVTSPDGLLPSPAFPSYGVPFYGART